MASAATQLSTPIQFIKGVGPKRSETLSQIGIETVDDLYILERLYSVGYGIVLRSSREDGFKELGEYVYQTIILCDSIMDYRFIYNFLLNLVNKPYSH